MSTDIVAAVPVVAEVAVKNPEMQKKNRIQFEECIIIVALANSLHIERYTAAITTVVTIAEILKNNGLATEKKVLTSTVGMKDETKGRLIQKARIEIVLRKTEKFDRVMAAPASAAPEAAAENKDEKETAAA
ncbi:hypothetical protein RHGRI_019784 [Rhododendron griersonianum]|uniref:DNA/RNA-binding protein Alba-like domain-containing protein n=1 Tax=Rhododendron griersonianum TaxID=479676 RepID=A0AAV6JGX1_9ERIC|nr:hypothetical protein RHGRI_019784 [Rhododendron griersonianum]